MSRARLYRYIATLVLIVALRALDLGLTYLYTPSLQGEWNPVVSRFRAAWVAMLAFQAALMCLIAFLMWFYFKYQRIEVPLNGLKYNQFVYYCFYGKLETGIKMIFSLPRNLRGMLIFNGFILMEMAIGVSVFAIVHNLLLLSGYRPYERFVFLHGTVYFASVFLGMAAAGTYGYFIASYLAYRRRA